MLTKTRKLFFLFILGVVAALPLAAQAEAEGGKVLLWEVVGEKGKAYILGSMHFATKDMYPLNPAIEDAFAESSTLVVEVDITATDQAEMQRKLLTEGAYTPGQDLTTNLPPDILEELKAFLLEREMRFEMLNPLKPWFVSIMLSAIELQRLGYQPEHGIDQYFLNRAKDQDKPIHSLETADFQIRMLSELSDELQQLFLVSTLRDNEQLAELIGTMATAWKEGDAETMEEIVQRSQREDERLEAVYEKVIYQRNLTMTEKIRGLLVSGDTWFVVVGASHVVGERGIVRLLANDPDTRFETRQISAAVPAATP
jgi:uncharacterized protein YbaP (TraB family)